jgi:hypothetical protein
MARWWRLKWFARPHDVDVMAPAEQVPAPEPASGQPTPVRSRNEHTAFYARRRSNASPRPW